MKPRKPTKRHLDPLEEWAANQHPTFPDQFVPKQPIPKVRNYQPYTKEDRLWRWSVFFWWFTVFAFLTGIAILLF